MRIIKIKITFIQSKINFYEIFNQNQLHMVNEFFIRYQLIDLYQFVKSIDHDKLPLTPIKGKEKKQIFNILPLSTSMGKENFHKALPFNKHV